ncbi:MAG TPA: FHIPEP family type III secretion protein, partial [Rhodocyclaceae bacterium]|nr:FHIPEP family type III secretion protein [Rhodocyclaceae bacterium]
QNADELTVQVRAALGRAIVQQLFPGTGEVQVMTLDPALERLLGQAVTGGGENASFEPGLADSLVRETVQASRRQEELGLSPVLLVPASLRVLLSRFLRRSVPQLKVLAHNEIPETRIIKVTSIIGGRA